MSHLRLLLEGQPAAAGLPKVVRPAADFVTGRGHCRSGLPDRRHQGCRRAVQREAPEGPARAGHRHRQEPCGHRARRPQEGLGARVGEVERDAAKASCRRTRWAKPSSRDGSEHLSLRFLRRVRETSRGDHGGLILKPDEVAVHWIELSHPDLNAISACFMLVPHVAAHAAPARAGRDGCSGGTDRVDLLAKALPVPLTMLHRPTSAHLGFLRSSRNSEVGSTPVTMT